MLVCNFVYDKVGEKKKKVMQYRKILPLDQVFSWEDCHHFAKAHYILMHSVIYRTQLLKDCGLRLPEHTFYVDNIYVFEPLPSVKRMYYLDVNLYRYYIGREDQSVHESVMIKRIDQQIRVNKIMFDYLTEHKQEFQCHKRLYQYAKNYLEIITAVSSIMLICANTEEHLKKKEELWSYFKDRDLEIYRFLRKGALGHMIHLPGKGGRAFCVGFYHVCQKIFKFN